jgi:hypothetical protein
MAWSIAGPNWRRVFSKSPTWLGWVEEEPSYPLVTAMPGAGLLLVGGMLLMTGWLAARALLFQHPPLYAIQTPRAQFDLRGFL